MTFWQRLTIRLALGLSGLLVACGGAELSGKLPASGSAGASEAEDTSKAGSTSNAEESGGVTWLTWSEAQEQAKERGAPVMVVLYADWCSRCTELKQFMKSDDFVAATRGLVLFRHNVERPAPWARELFADRGSYVPRVFFLSPSGSLHPELVSNNRRFPHFFSASQGYVLTRTMALAVERLSQPTDVSALPAD